MRMREPFATANAAMSVTADLMPAGSGVPKKMISGSRQFSGIRRKLGEVYEHYC
jgi:hypothetical protein